MCVKYAFFKFCKEQGFIHIAHACTQINYINNNLNLTLIFLMQHNFFLFFNFIFYTFNSNWMFHELLSQSTIYEHNHILHKKKAHNIYESIEGIYDCLISWFIWHKIVSAVRYSRTNTLHSKSNKPRLIYNHWYYNKKK